MIGQEHVARALSNAITTNRVGHAYLFTAPAVVGKTSAARIFAKALIAYTVRRPTPCNECEICQSISSGGDVDVQEMDGASNRGIGRFATSGRASRCAPAVRGSRFYIIDEVHMLTKEAFNALLKTLEERRACEVHFCTTERKKSDHDPLRCQRFDFAGVQTASIAQRLEQIAKEEGVEAEPEAIEILSP